MAKASATINLSEGAEANSNARKVATNYLSSDSTGIMVAELSGSQETPSTATGNNVRITSTTVDVRKGQNTLTSMGQSGMQIYNGSGTQIANLGYGSGASASGTANAPYFDLGVRKSNTTKGNYSVAEGYDVTASGYRSHAEGGSTTASSKNAHAEGYATTASGESSHAEGDSTTASGYTSHAEGLSTKATGSASHAQGYGTETNEDYGVVLGKLNSAKTGYAVVVGGGTGTTKQDILRLDWSGNVTSINDITASGDISADDITASGDVTANGASLSGALQKSGGTMTGRIITSFHDAVAMGSYGTSQTTIGGLVDEVRFSSGCAGSASIGTAYTANGVTIPTGWYNFLYSPHRNGGIDGTAQGDNCNYGNLLLMGMNNTNGMFRVRVSSGAVAGVTRLAEASDYIIENGNDGNWYYEKWASGKVEAIFRGSVTYGTMSASGQLYRSTGNPVAIPTGIFPATPQRTNITVNSGNTVVVSATGVALSETSVSVQVWRSTNASSSIDMTIDCVYRPSPA